MLKPDKHTANNPTTSFTEGTEVQGLKQQKICLPPTKWGSGHWEMHPVLTAQSRH